MSSKNIMSLESSRLAFEAWYGTTKHDPYAQWHEDKQRYTVMSLKQYLWEAWKASKEYNAD